jgi:hypothetical protein
VIAVVLRRFGRLRLGVDGGPLHRASVGRDGTVRRAHVFRMSPPRGSTARWRRMWKLTDAGWGRFNSILRAKSEEAGRIRIEVDPRHTCDRLRTAGAQHRRTASPTRYFVAAHAVTGPRRPTNTPHITSHGLDWPFRCKPREKKPTASNRR